MDEWQEQMARENDVIFSCFRLQIEGKESHGGIGTKGVERGCGRVNYNFSRQGSGKI